MRRAYIEANLDLRDAIELALTWADADDVMIRVPTTQLVKLSPCLTEWDVPITSPSPRSKFYKPADGIVLAVDLNVPELLADDRNKRVNGLVAIHARGANPHDPGIEHHGPWITAYDAEHLGGDEIASVPDAHPAIKAAMAGLSGFAVSNQGLLDKRERSGVIETLMFLRDNGIPLNPDAVMVEAFRNQWGKQGPEEARHIAVTLARGTTVQIPHPGRIAPAVMNDWLHTTEQDEVPPL